MKKPKKQYFLVEVTLRKHDYPCSWSGHKQDIKQALIDHDDINSVKVNRFNPKLLQDLEETILRMENEALRVSRRGY